MPREMVKRVNISLALSSSLLMLSYVSLLSFLLDNLCEMFSEQGRSMNSSKK